MALVWRLERGSSARIQPGRRFPLLRVECGQSGIRLSGVRRRGFPRTRIRGFGGCWGCGWGWGLGFGWGGFGWGWPYWGLGWDAGWGWPGYWGPGWPGGYDPWWGPDGYIGYPADGYQYGPPYAPPPDDSGYGDYYSYGPPYAAPDSNSNDYSTPPTPENDQPPAAQPSPNADTSPTTSSPAKPQPTPRVEPISLLQHGG